MGGEAQWVVGFVITQLKTRFIICEYFRFSALQNWLNCSRPCSICIQCAPSSSCQRAASSRPHWATRINGARLFTISSRRPWPRIQRNVPQPNDCCSIRLSSARCRSEWPRSCCRSTRVPISIIIVSTVMRRWVEERGRERKCDGEGKRRPRPVTLLQKPLATFVCNLFALLVLLCWRRVCGVVRVGWCRVGGKAWRAAASANLARQLLMPPPYFLEVYFVRATKIEDLVRPLGSIVREKPTRQVNDIWGV